MDFTQIALAGKYIGAGLAVITGLGTGIGLAFLYAVAAVPCSARIVTIHRKQL